MAVLGSPNYRVGLIIAKSQPLHNGHLKILTDAYMYCDEVIFSVRDYDTAFFDYNITQKLHRRMYNLVDGISFFGTKFDPLLGTPKHVIMRTLEELDDANYNKPTHFFTHYDAWIEPARESMLVPHRVATLPDHDSEMITQSINDGTDFWKDKVPHRILEDIETFIITKNKNS